MFVRRLLIGLVGGLLGVGISLVFIAWFLQREHDRNVAEAQRDIEVARQRVADLERNVGGAREAQRKRIQQAAFHARRTAVIDAQCLRQGKPMFGYVIEGSTYEDNVLV